VPVKCDCPNDPATSKAIVIGFLLQWVDRALPGSPARSTRCLIPSPGGVARPRQKASPPTKSRSKSSLPGGPPVANAIALLRLLPCPNGCAISRGFPAHSPHDPAYRDAGRASRLAARPCHRPRRGSPGLALRSTPFAPSLRQRPGRRHSSSPSTGLILLAGEQYRRTRRGADPWPSFHPSNSINPRPFPAPRHPRYPRKPRRSPSAVAQVAAPDFARDHPLRAIKPWSAGLRSRSLDPTKKTAPVFQAFCWPPATSIHLAARVYKLPASSATSATAIRSPKRSVGKPLCRRGVLILRSGSSSSFLPRTPTSPSPCTARGP